MWYFNLIVDLASVLQRLFLFHSCIMFQLNISFPATGCQKLIEVDDEKKLRSFYEKRIGMEVDASCLGNEWKVIISF